MTQNVSLIQLNPRVGKDSQLVATNQITKHLLVPATKVRASEDVGFLTGQMLHNLTVSTVVSKSRSKDTVNHPLQKAIGLSQIKAFLRQINYNEGARGTPLLPSNLIFT